MKLLFDQNLSHRLISALADVYPESLHVRDMGLKEASDTDIWDYAARHGYAIVSKDFDFHQRSFLEGHPPKVIWLRVGNGPTSAIETMLRIHREAVLEFEQSDMASFLILA